MTRQIRTVVFVIACLAGFVPVAHAGILDWIDEMSGPGPFLGLTLEARIHCFGIDKNGSFGTLGSEVNKACLVNRLRNSPTSQRPLVTFNVTGEVAWSIDNKLPYAPGNTASTRVWILAAEPSVWVLPIPQVAIGTSVGVNRFSGAAFDAFYRGYVRPAVEVKPFNFPGGPSKAWVRAVVVRASLMIMPTGVEAADFGAIGPYKTSHEVLPTIGVGFDFGNYWLH
jgi:hypothetical protein